ncbi:MAG: hypothetical protein ABI947_20345 [Chloroflexota bacterium]
MTQRILQPKTGFGERSFSGLLDVFSGWLRGDWPAEQPPALPAYLLRKRELPNTFTSQDWQRALEYWDYKCAVCERPRGLWHTLAQDHWIPLTNPLCPGTNATNILPLCHGTDGCNNSKGKLLPEVWLHKKLGKRRAVRKLEEIQTYFHWIEDLTAARLGCPYCGGRVHHHDEWHVWECTSCEAFWNEHETRHYENCPKCQCWMIGASGTHDAYVCPRCNLEWDHANLPTHEKCPGCQRGAVKWTYQHGESAGYWKCNRCRSEWTFD